MSFDSENDLWSNYREYHTYPWSLVTAPITARMRGQPWAKVSPFLCSICRTHSSCFCLMSGCIMPDNSWRGAKSMLCNFWKGKQKGIQYFPKIWENERQLMCLLSFEDIWTWKMNSFDYLIPSSHLKDICRSYRVSVDLKNNSNHCAMLSPPPPPPLSLRKRSFNQPCEYRKGRLVGWWKFKRI